MDPWAEYRIPTRRRRQPQSAGEEFYDNIARRALNGDARDRQREAVTRIDPNPDQAGEARRLSKQTGAPAPVVRENLTDFREDEQRADVSRAATDPRLGPWLGQNAEIASDDISTLLGVGFSADRYNVSRRFQVSSFFDGDAQAAREYRQTASPAQRRYDTARIYEAGEPSRIEEAQSRGVVGQTLGSIRAGTAASAGGFLGYLAQTSTGASANPLDPISQLYQLTGIPQALAIPEFERALLERQSALEEYAAENRGRSDSFIADSLYGGVESVPLSVAAVATRNPNIASALFFTSSSGNSYAEARGAGLSVEASSRYGARDGAIEVLTERLPIGRLLDIANGNGTVRNALKRFALGEVAGEQAATFLQDLNRFATLEPDRPLTEFLNWEERSTAAARTFLGTLSGAGPQATFAYGMQRAFREELRLESSVERLDALDALIQGSADSKARGRDPIAFRALLDQLTGDGENIHVPASAIAEFNQDYRDDNFWGDYANQIDEGLATGRDVAIPLAAAASRLAGTPDWDAISGDVRVGPDGATRNEIDEANAELEALKIEAGEQLDAADRVARQDAAPRERLREGIRAQLMNTGMTPDVANANAEIVAALFETEAANLGREITGNEFSDAVSVQRVLPELLATPEATETLDIIINAMRQGNDTQVGVGESLLQFIAGRGGINDPGGDFKSMGLPKRYIRDYDPRQASITGISDEGDFGIDSTLRAAIEAGYFSDLAMVEEEQGVSTLDTQVLLDAIGQELAGEKVFSESREDQYRAAGEELRQMLDARGLSADATDVQIRQAVADYERAQAREFNQTKIDPDLASDILSDRRVARGFSFKESKKLWRGESEASGSGMATYGLGDYSTTNKAYARNFGDVREVSRWEIADNPIRFKTVNDYQIWLQQAQSKLGYKDKRDFVKDYSDIGDFIRALDPSVDGIQVGPSSDAIIVTYSVDDSRSFNQYGKQTPQGQIAIGDAQAVIKLFETANLSTFQHEFAHFWLERFKANAEVTLDTDGNAAARKTFADYETLKGWFAESGFAIAEDGTIPVEAHELFARSWERYLFEGKAPKPSLNGVFRKFAAWMRSIYRLVKNLNAPITPEVREVMDRMLATQDEIAMAAEDRAMNLLFDNAVDAGMSEAEATRYGELAQEARSQAEEELEGKVMRSIRAREQKQWRAQERVVRSEVTEMIEARPVFKALDMLRGEYRLDRDFIINEYGEDALKLLPAGVPPLYKVGGDNADQIAEMAGFKSGDQMVRELMGMETQRKEMKANGDKRSVKKATIDQEVAITMHDRFGDPLGDGSIEREAQAAIQNERQGERIELELKALASQTNRRATPYTLAQEWAAERIASGVVADTISGEAQQRYTRTAAKASRDAMKAFARGDTEAAFEAKQTEMLHNALAREAAKASDAVDKAVRRMGDLAKQRTVKSMSQDYLDRIHGLLEGYEFKRVSQRAIDARDEYARWAQEQTEAGHDVVAVERLAQAKNYSRMTVEELLSLNDAVKQLVHMGRYKQTLIDGKERREFDAVVGEAIGSANELPQKKAKDQFGGETTLDWIKGGFASLHSVLVKMEDVFDRLDGDHPNGVFNRVAFAPIVEAQANEQVMLDDYMARLMEAMQAVPKERVKRWHEKNTIDELPGIDKYGRSTGEPVSLLGEELLVMAMNMGNRGNMEKLIAGYGWDKQLGGMDAAADVVLDVLNRELSIEDWQYVQTVWDTIDELWPEISALEKRVNGFAPDKVEAVPIQTSAGELKGGYFPVVYDPESKVGGRNLEVEERGLFASSYFRSTTRSGSTHERTQFKGPLHLSLGVINRHVAEVVHDITHREAVMNADKFLSDDRVQQAVIDTMGPEIAQQFRPWLSHIANEWATDREGNSQAERFLKATRTNATVVGLGFRISTIMLQVSGYANSIERVGMIPVARGIRKMLSGTEAWTYALENSKELKSRMTTLDRDIRDNARRLASKQKGVLDAAQRFAFHGIGYMDRFVTVGTWHGAYDKALGQGMDHDQAVYEADKVVRQSQGSGAAKDMARVQRGTGKMGEAWKLSTMFYSYSSAFYQRQVKLYRDTGDAVRDRDIEQLPDLAARFLWLNIVPAILSQWLAGRGPEEDEDEAAWALSHIITSQFQAIPFAREIAGGLQSGFGYSYTPAEGFGKSIVAVAKDAERVYEGEDTKRATRNFMEAVGYTTGKIPGQLASSTQFLVNVGYGEEDPDTIAEWWEGITKGKIEE